MSPSETQKEQKTTNGSVFRSKPTNKDRPTRAAVKQVEEPKRTWKDKVSDYKVPIAIAAVAGTALGTLIGLKVTDKMPALPGLPGFLKRGGDGKPKTQVA